MQRYSTQQAELVRVENFLVSRTVEISLGLSGKLSPHPPLHLRTDNPNSLVMRARQRAGRSLGARLALCAGQSISHEKRPSRRHVLTEHFAPVYDISN